MQKLDSQTLRTHKGVSYVGVATAAICHDGNGNFVLMKRGQKARDEQGRWDILSGGLKHGATLEDNIRRELQEELCAEALAISPIGHAELHRTLDDGTPTHWITIYYCIQVDRTTVRVGEPDVIDEVKWFTFDTLPSPLHSMFSKVLEKRETIEEAMKTHSQ